ncbi:hypothetical protein EJB05_05419, partial [Eragrostis curvula]
MAYGPCLDGPGPCRAGPPIWPSIVPACGNFFHVGCDVDRWLRARRTCPLCRGWLDLAAAAQATTAGLPAHATASGLRAAGPSSILEFWHGNNGITISLNSKEITDQFAEHTKPRTMSVCLRRSYKTQSM